ncbi:hypothetical protein COHA_001103 [Chlorella ohadii]|uniref:Acyltransferase n=1 Tax=Chlorella ohadii TaxID=2649997 RepID=A0AAD5DZF4_9CHLO|nr:hypothetical protein COHA_001103 [Chlorella ohadii]
MAAARRQAAAPPPVGQGTSRLPSLATFLGVAWIPAGFLAVVFGLLAALLLLPRPWNWAVVGLNLATVLLPLQLPPPRWAARFLRFSIAESRRYYPITLVYEDKDAFSQEGPHMIAYEPHSVLPFGGCVFTEHAEGMPRCLTNTYVASTSTVFICPWMRHLAYWLGCRPASREVLRRSLAAGKSIFVCPGGVQECFYMEPDEDKEVVFLKKRTGFVRLAIQAGAPIVPVFAFGQTPHFRFWRPFIDWPAFLFSRTAMSSVVRRIGYVPMLVWGWLGTALPHAVPMHVVIGRPIAVPQEADPSPETVQRYLKQYIAAIEGLFERYKAAAGHPAATLTVY